MSKSDCGIVGGGLGGLSLALLLAKKGLKVTLFEKNEYPFHKVCGEYIAQESWPHLGRLGISPEALHLPHIQRLLITAGKTRLETSLTTGGYGISRYTLDGLLAKKCREFGVNLLEKTSVKSVTRKGEQFVWETSKGVFSSQFACGAYGKHANLDRELRPEAMPHKQSIPTFVGVKHHLKTYFPKDLIALHNFQGGYAGISAIENDRVCFCYMVSSKALKAAGNIERLESEVMSQNPYLKSIFKEAEFLYSAPQTIGQIHFQSRSLIQDGVFLLGDASGMIPPLCGNGMSMALRASALLAPLIVAGYEGQLKPIEIEGRYHQAWQESFGLRLKAGHKLQNIFGQILPTQSFLNALRPFPWFSQRLIRATHGSPF